MCTYYEDSFMNSMVILRITVMALSISSTLFIIFTIIKAKKFGIAYKLVLFQATIELIEQSCAIALTHNVTESGFCQFQGYILQAFWIISMCTCLLMVLIVYSTATSKGPILPNQIHICLILIFVLCCLYMIIPLTNDQFQRTGWKFNKIEYYIYCGFKINYTDYKSVIFTMVFWIGPIIILNLITIIYGLKVRSYYKKIHNYLIGCSSGNELDDIFQSINSLMVFPRISCGFWVFNIITNNIFPLIFYDGTPRILIIAGIIFDLQIFLNGIAFYFVFRKYINFQKVWSLETYSEKLFHESTITQSDNIKYDEQKQ